MLGINQRDQRSVDLVEGSMKERKSLFVQGRRGGFVPTESSEDDDVSLETLGSMADEGHVFDQMGHGSCP